MQAALRSTTCTKSRSRSAFMVMRTLMRSPTFSSAGLPTISRLTEISEAEAVTSVLFWSN